MGGPPETGPADFWPLVDKFSWYRADAALARFRQTSHGHDAVIAILGRNGNQTPQEPGADQSRGTAPLPRRFWHVAGETCRVPGEEGAGQEARDDRGDARLQASDPWRAGAHVTTLRPMRSSRSTNRPRWSPGWASTVARSCPRFTPRPACGTTPSRRCRS